MLNLTNLKAKDIHFVELLFTLPVNEIEVFR